MVDFPAPVAPTSATHSPGSTLQRHVVEDRPVLDVREAGVLQFECTAFGQRGAAFRFRRCARDLGDAVERGFRREELVQQLGHLAERHEHLHRGEHARGDGADAQRAVEGEQRRRDEHDCSRRRLHERERREEADTHTHAVEVAVDDAFVGACERRELVRLAAVRAHRLRAFGGLDDGADHLADAAAVLGVDDHARAPEPMPCDRERRDDDQAEGADDRRQEEHREDRGNEIERVLGCVRQHLHGGLGERFGVGRDARDHIAAGCAFVGSQVHAQHAREGAEPEPVQDALGRDGHGRGADPAGDAAADRHHEVRDRRGPQGRAVAGVDAVVDRGAHEQRSDHGRGTGEDDEDEHERDALALPPEFFADDRTGRAHGVDLHAPVSDVEDLVGEIDDARVRRHHDDEPVAPFLPQRAQHAQLASRVERARRPIEQQHGWTGQHRAAPAQAAGVGRPTA